MGGDAGCGDDCTDPSGTSGQGRTDQEAGPGFEGCPEHGSQGGAERRDVGRLRAQGFSRGRSWDCCSAPVFDPSAPKGINMLSCRSASNRRAEQHIRSAMSNSPGNFPAHRSKIGAHVTGRPHPPIVALTTGPTTMSGPCASSDARARWRASQRRSARPMSSVYRLRHVGSPVGRDSSRRIHDMIAHECSGACSVAVDHRLENGLVFLPDLDRHTGKAQNLSHGAA